MNVRLFVIPGLTRNPVFSWIPASAGMTCSVVINDVVYNKIEGLRILKFLNPRIPKFANFLIYCSTIGRVVSRRSCILLQT
jgi:hypothetical protein